MADYTFRTGNVQDEPQPIVPPEIKEAIKDYWEYMPRTQEPT